MNLTQTQQDDRVAQTIIGSALDITVRVHDDGTSDGMYDLEFEYLKGTTVAAEVVSNRQESLQRTWNQTRRVGYQARGELTRFWTITVHHGSNPMKLKNRIMLLLTDLEARDITEASELDLYDLYDDPEKDWPEIDGISSREPTERRGAGFQITMSGWTGWVGDGDDALSYVEEQLSTTWLDVVRKLTDTGRVEGHAVVLLVDDVIGPKWAIEEGETPMREPELPTGVDALWIISLRFPLRCVYWLPGQVWQEVIATPEDYLAVCAANLV